MPDRILLVDDENSVLFALRDHFLGHGYHVDCAAEAASARVFLEQNTYSTAVIDLQLGLVSQASLQGLDLIGDIRDRYPQTKVIALTGHSSPQVEREARQRGASAFMSKPPRLVELNRLAASYSRGLVMGAPAKILVVDDEPANCELLREILSPHGLEIFTAFDGRSCLDEFRRVQPDLVLLDVQLPLLDGFEVCRRIKNDPDTRLIPIVLVTALSAVEDRVRGIACGADDFLTKPLDSTQLLARVRSLLNLKNFTDELERAESILFALARSIEAKDPCTEGHCDRLSEYASALGERMGLPANEIVALRRAGIVHDIGKVAIPDAILLKPSALNADERLAMQQHTLVGEKICAPLKSFRLVLPIIRSHHEKMDGSGYPDGLKRFQIPAPVRILQIVDVYDALKTKRPYKPAMSREEALNIMEAEVEKGWWDGETLGEFRRLLQKKSSMGCVSLSMAKGA